MSTFDQILNQEPEKKPDTPVIVNSASASTSTQSQSDPPSGDKTVPALSQNETPAAPTPVLAQQSAGQTQQGVINNEVHPNGGTTPKTDEPALAQQTPEQPVVSPTAVVEPPKENNNTSTTTSSVQSQANEQQEQRLTYEEMVRQTSTYKPPTPEELAAEKKKQKREAIFAAIGDGIAALSNVWFASQSGVSMYDGKSGMSAAHNEKWDKIQKERDKNSENYNRLIMQARQLDDDAARDERDWKNTLEQQKAAADRWQQQFEYQQGRDKLADDRYTEEQNYRKERDKKADEFREKQFNESVRQFKVSSAQQATRIKAEATRLNRELKKDVVSFTLGKGNGNIEVPSHALNSANVAYIFSLLGKDICDSVVGDPIYDKLTGQIIDYKPPTTEAMLVAIGSHIKDSPEVQNALRELGGQKPKDTKGRGY